MFGPGEYVPDPTEGIIDVNDLPQPILVAYDHNHDHSFGDLLVSLLLDLS